jgi:hypothetical protein
MGSPDSVVESTLAHRDPAIDACSVDDSWFQAAAAAPPTIDPAAARNQPLGSASLSVAAPELAGRASRRRPAGARVTGAPSRRVNRGSRGFARVAALGAVALVVVVALALAADPPRASHARTPSHAGASGGRPGHLKAPVSPRAPRPDAAGLLLSPITAKPSTTVTRASHAASHHHAAEVPAGAGTRAAPATPAAPPAAPAVSTPRTHSAPPGAPAYHPRPPRRLARPSVTPGDLTPAEAIN